MKGWQKRMLVGTGWEEPVIIREHGPPEPGKEPVVKQTHRIVRIGR